MHASCGSSEQERSTRLGTIYAHNVHPGGLQCPAPKRMALRPGPAAPCTREPLALRPKILKSTRPYFRMHSGPDSKECCLQHYVPSACMCPLTMRQFYCWHAVPKHNQCHSSMPVNSALWTGLRDDPTAQSQTSPACYCCKLSANEYFLHMSRQTNFAPVPPVPALTKRDCCAWVFSGCLLCIPLKEFQPSSADRMMLQERLIRPRPGGAAGCRAARSTPRCCT